MNYNPSNWPDSVKQEDVNCDTRTDHFERQDCLQRLKKLIEKKARIMHDLSTIDGDIETIVNQLVSDSNASDDLFNPHLSQLSQTSNPISQSMSTRQNFDIYFSDNGFVNAQLREDDGLLAETSEASAADASSAHLSSPSHADLPQQDQSVQNIWFSGPSASKRSSATAGSSGAKKPKQKRQARDRLD